MGGDPHTTTVNKNVSKNGVYMLIIMIRHLWTFFLSFKYKKGGHLGGLVG